MSEHPKVVWFPITDVTIAPYGVIIVATEEGFKVARPDEFRGIRVELQVIVRMQVT